MGKDKFKIDSHKLNYHPRRVAGWLEGRNVYPIYMEMSPAGACNHRCVFCGLDFMGYRNRRLETPMLRKLIPELGRLGLKSIMHGGEGEPLLHKDIVEIAGLTVKNGIDCAITTNGVLLKGSCAEPLVESCKWIKVSINAGTPETYSKIHRAKPSDFNQVIENLSNAAQIKRSRRLSCTLGMQIILLPENRDEIPALAKTAMEIGMDYLVVKPYSQHTQSETDVYRNIKYGKDLRLADELEKFNSENFSVIFRMNTMIKWDKPEKSYGKCMALPFWSYIDAGGNVWGCSMFLEDNRFLYGNVNESSFEEIWEGEARKKSLDMMEGDFDISKCRVNCRMDEINRYLWELKNPGEHVNFI